MFRGVISSRARARFFPQIVLRIDYTLFVFDEALVIAPAGAFERLRMVAGQLPGIVGPVLDRISSSAAKKEAATLEHEVEELPPDITVEQLVERVDHARAVPTADIASLVLKSKLIGGAYLVVRFASR